MLQHVLNDITVVIFSKGYICAIVVCYEMLLMHNQSLTCARSCGVFEFEPATNFMEIPMWKTLVAGTTLLTIAGTTLASAQQPAPAERPHHVQLTADDIAAFTDARLAALKTALKLTPAQEKNWPAVEQALRDNSTARITRRDAQRAAGPQTDPIERLRNHADAMTARADALRRLAEAEKPLYQSLDDAQKRRFAMAMRFAARGHHMAEQRMHREAAHDRG
jgi:hypothetical protein